MDGFISSFISTLVTYPLRVITTQYQIHNSPTFKGVVSSIYNKNGKLGFFRGVGFQVSTYPIFWTVFFQVDHHLNSNKIVNTFVASSIGSLVSNPFFVVSTRLQTLNLTNRPSNGFLISKDIFYQEGIRGFFKGYGMTLCNNLKLMVNFPLYYYLKEDQECSILSSSFISKLISNNLFYPTDVIRSQIRNSSEKLNLLEVIKNNRRNLFRGGLFYNLYTIPNFVIMMSMKEYLN